MNTRKPDRHDKCEIAGRVYQSIDLSVAIENGRLTTLDEVLEWSKKNQAELNVLMELPVWVITDEALVDIPASVELNQSSNLSALQEYLSGLKEAVVQAAQCLLQYGVAVLVFAVAILALLGILDIFIESPILQFGWLRMVSWVAIAILAGALFYGHIERTREKGRSISVRRRLGGVNSKGEPLYFDRKD